ncbi:DNA polymerase III subunit chi [Xinfangfangia sp. CPCC 101601]|uniref:DNA polymerase III subunit chi n=1 Tax=Pseudogemmobacter lacusdianii TaxID=3069608 RepID=A0ABU0VVC7_9RHOB|nr:DNA polymerase III subunit chi [Xinfangfangia sp. CPCC 101601]MDQ2065603.1 DNA polymerase III subunit chi [Xinfangfangia sp. CPCC 101601]
MASVNFYHLQRHSMDEVIDMLVPRALGQGWRVMIRHPERAVLERLDNRLWQHSGAGIVPHGLEGGAQDSDQPVLLGAGPVGNAAQCLLLMGPLPVDAAEAAALERIWLVFDGRDQTQVQEARMQWKAVTAAGLAAQYWNDESGRWDLKAEAAAKA